MVDGIVDYLEKFKIKVFGPNKVASQLEGSKIFTNNFAKNLISQQLNLVFLKIEMTQKILETSNFPIVIKADNLASGKEFTFLKIK